MFEIELRDPAPSVDDPFKINMGDEPPSGPDIIVIWITDDI